MPVTRGRARKMEASQEEDEESTQLTPQQTQEPDELEEETQSTDQDPVDLKHMLVQLTQTVKQLLKNHRELEDDAEMIQAGVDELYRMQEARAQHIVGRLKNASSNILTFGDASQEGHRERAVSGGDNEGDTMD